MVKDKKHLKIVEFIGLELKKEECSKLKVRDIRE